MRKKKEFFTPDLTPLIDVVFLLLIFFLVTSVFKKDELGLLLNLPSAQNTTQNIKYKDIDILLTQKKLAYEKDVINFQELEEKLSLLKDKKELINIRIDKDVKYQRIMKVLDILKKYNLTNIALVNK